MGKVCVNSQEKLIGDPGSPEELKFEMNTILTGRNRNRKQLVYLKKRLNSISKRRYIKSTDTVISQ